MPLGAHWSAQRTCHATATLLQVVWRAIGECTCDSLLLSALRTLDMISLKGAERKTRKMKKPVEKGNYFKM